MQATKSPMSSIKKNGNFLSFWLFAWTGFFDSMRETRRDDPSFTWSQCLGVAQLIQPRVYFSAKSVGADEQSSNPSARVHLQLSKNSPGVALQQQSSVSNVHQLHTHCIKTLRQFEVLVKLMTVQGGQLWCLSLTFRLWTEQNMKSTEHLWIRGSGRDETSQWSSVPRDRVIAEANVKNRSLFSPSHVGGVPVKVRRVIDQSAVDASTQSFTSWHGHCVLFCFT